MEPWDDYQPADWWRRYLDPLLGTDSEVAARRSPVPATNND